MAGSGQTREKEVKLSFKGRLIGWNVASLVRFFSMTYRWRLHDLAGVTNSPPNHPMIWTLWHNRIFAILVAYRKYLPFRQGATLTSASKDGEIIAAAAGNFDVDAVRGSSSRRGAAALVELKNRIKGGSDILIVPDGPRGPRYRCGPGAVKLAQLTDAKILPIRIEYSSYWKFKSWDQFRLPKPFSTVDIYFEALVEVPSELSDEDFEKERQRVENILNPSDETD
jgi:hypothetical protein